MKTKFILITMMIGLTALAVSAQKKMTDFAGDWKLDMSVSKLSDRDRVESMTMKVTQTDNQLMIESETKRAASAEGAMRSNRPGRGEVMFGGGVDKQTLTYDLGGTETKAKVDAGRFAGEKKLKAKNTKEGKLALVQTLSFGSGENTREIKTNETWELQDNGKVLKVTREFETPRGAQTSELYFNKQ